MLEYRPKPKTKNYKHQKKKNKENLCNFGSGKIFLVVVLTENKYELKYIKHGVDLYQKFKN